MLNFHSLSWITVRRLPRIKANAFHLLREVERNEAFCSNVSRYYSVLVQFVCRYLQRCETQERKPHYF
jgi:hypothetical protein